jgi:sugar phosphate permease
MFGIFVVAPTAGQLIFSCGWESVFYVYGVVAILLGILWEFLVYDSPDDHPRISEEERKYIVGAIGTHNVGNKQKMKASSNRSFLLFLNNKLLKQ